MPFGFTGRNLSNSTSCPALSCPVLLEPPPSSAEVTSNSSSLSVLAGGGGANSLSSVGGGRTPSPRWRGGELPLLGGGGGGGGLPGPPSRQLLRCRPPVDKARFKCCRGRRLNFMTSFCRNDDGGASVGSFAHLAGSPRAVGGRSRDVSEDSTSETGSETDRGRERAVIGAHFACRKVICLGRTMSVAYWPLSDPVNRIIWRRRGNNRELSLASPPTTPRRAGGSREQGRAGTGGKGRVEWDGEKRGGRHLAWEVAVGEVSLIRRGVAPRRSRVSPSKWRCSQPAAALAATVAHRRRWWRGGGGSGEDSGNVCDLRERRAAQTPAQCPVYVAN